MGTIESLNSLIDEAAAKAGNQAKLAKLLEIPRSHITDMKKGVRPANWRIRGGLLAIVSGDPARAFMTAIAEDLEQSEKADEKKAAEGFKAMLAAFPEQEKQKALSDNTQGLASGGNGGIRTLDEALHPILP